MQDNWKRSIVLFIASQTLSLFGSSLVQYAIMWHITLETQSGAMMTIFIICGFLPIFFIAPFAGVWADRYNRKVLIVLSDSVIASVTLILAILFITGYREVWLLFTISAVRGLGQAVQMPAVSALIPQIVPEDKLMKVNGANSSIQSMILLVSPVASGALLTLAAIEIIFFIDVVTAAAAVSVLLLFLPIPAHAKALEKQKISYFRDLSAGFLYIKSHRFIRSFFLFCGLFFILAAPMAFLTPLQVTRSFGDDVWRLTAIEITFSVGMMAGGIIMASWGGFKNKIKTMILASLIMGAGTISLGIIPVFWLYCTLMAVVGLAMPMLNTPATVLIQQKVEEEFMGRVFGVLSMISSSMMPLSMLIFGPMADQIKIEWMLVCTGILMIADAVLLLTRKTMIEIGRS
ncbi:MAG TPA: MFS transporter [Anaerovoracaceae bacterium]|nr:MFS transporter [Anaerovoracaceae bacterium]